MTIPSRLEPDDDDNNSHEQPLWNQPVPEYGERVSEEQPEQEGKLEDDNGIQ